MNLKLFLRHYRPTFDDGNAPLPASLKKRVNNEFLCVLDKLGGKTFNHGIFRFYRGDQIKGWTELISNIFVAVQGQGIAFGCDWLGRQFILDNSEPVAGNPTVVCLEPGVPDSFCTDLPIVEFHNRVLVEKGEAALAKTLYQEWRKHNRVDIPPAQCVGYRVPLFLGGEDTLMNLEMIDMEVYLHFFGQLWEEVRKLPEGSPIGEISIRPVDGRRSKKQ
jgi:hypothetical protein